MNQRLFGPLVFFLISLVATSVISYNIAWSDKDWCYDQVGDGHPCFETEKKCKHEAKLDDAESPCYDEDKDDR
ncbi:MAG TPA: hypothetical protein VJS91_09140 [Nitrososphaeraceae archaeon]|nr:hypothetical protein [Nitrososphaeraceae archaeon]